jgi:hypothetical protein
VKVLVACEESQTVCKAFRAQGHEAWSCDVEPCSGGHPEWHLQGDALAEAYSGKYDLIIAHPPCTYLSKAGARWMYPRAGEVDPVRLRQCMVGRAFFLALLNAPAPYIAVENPTPLRLADLPPHTQAVQPYEYGHPYSKRTLLWLRGLPPLQPTNVLQEWKPYLPSNTGGVSRGQQHSSGVAKNAKEASTTFAGVAQAMATQWSAHIKRNGGTLEGA